MRYFPAKPQEIFSSLWRNRDLLLASTKREVLGRYQGSVMGILWSFLNPLLMLSVYTFIFSVIFKARWHGGSSSQTEFALILFSGLIVFNIFSECINRAPSIITSNSNYVKKVIFPLEILPCIPLASALFHSLISFAVWIIAYTALFSPPHATTLFLPLIIIPLLFFSLGISWILASLGVFLRDIAQITGLLTSALMFLSPIFYPIASIPENYRVLIYINPLTAPIEQTRGVLFWGTPPDLLVVAASWLGSAAIAWLGFAFFQKTRRGFSDAL